MSQSGAHTHDSSAADPAQAPLTAPSDHPRRWRQWRPRPESTLLLLALVWTVAAKLLVVLRQDPVNALSAWGDVAMPDVAFTAGLAGLFALAYRYRPRPWVARLALLVASLVLAWAMLNAAWLLATEVQLQPGILAVLLRDPVQFWPVVETHLRQRLIYAIPIGLTGVVAVLWFVLRMVRPVPIVLRPRRYAIRAAAWISLAILAYPMDWLCHRVSGLGFAGEVLGFSSHVYALRVALPRNNGADAPQAPARSLPRAGEREIGLPDGPLAELPNIVIVLLESLSHQITTLGDPQAGTTPALAALASEGTQFVCTRVPISQTTKAYWSTLTGSLPDAWGDFVEAVPVDRPYESLASILRRAGYRSGFFEVSRGTFECAPGLFANLGFDWAWFRENLQDPSAHLGYLGGDDLRTIDPMFAWIDQGPRPFLAVMITTVAHDPYELPAWFSDPIDDRPAAYRRSVEYTDHVLGKLCERLDERGLTPNTVLCVLGDHGLSLRSHDRFGRWVPYEELIRIPWIMRWPGRLEAGRRIEWPCSQLDVTPTLLSLLGFDIDRAGFDGRDALEPGPEDRRLYFYSGFADSPLGCVTGGQKWVFWPYTESLFAYDLSLDPGETQPATLEGAEKEQIVRDLLGWRDGTLIRVPARRFAEKTVFDHWQVFSSGRTAWAYYVP